MDNTLTTVEENRTLNLSVRDITSASGKVTGQRFTYAGTETPTEIKARLKAANPEASNTQISKTLREILKGNMSLAWAEQSLMMRHLESLGAIPVTTEIRKGTAVTRFVIPPKEKAQKDSPEAILMAAAHKLAEATGWTVEESLARLK